MDGSRGAVIITAGDLEETIRGIKGDLDGRMDGVLEFAERTLDTADGACGIGATQLE